MNISKVPSDGQPAVASSVNTIVSAAQLASTEPRPFQQRLESVMEARAHPSGQLNASPSNNEELRKAFQDFVGQTLFSQMIASMRKTQEGAAYFNGGQAEKIFQCQLDQILSQELSDAAASQISDPMFNLFQLRRS